MTPLISLTSLGDMKKDSKNNNKNGNGRREDLTEPIISPNMICNNLFTVEIPLVSRGTGTQ